MTTPRVCVLRAPGTNCDVETAYAFETAGAVAERMHLFRLLETPRRLGEYHILCIPGGFSYGDDIGAGVVCGQKLRKRLSDALADFLRRNTLVLGICNGFQVLLRAGILPSGTDDWQTGSGQTGNGDGPSPPASPPATLTWNENGRYTAAWVHLSVHAPQNVFLQGIEHIELPIAHAEGKFVTRDATLPAQWRQRQQIAVCYAQPEEHQGHLRRNKADNDSETILPTPFNPNGSVANIAGLSDPSGRVLGLMPHPERFLHATQHPRWTRLGLRGEGDGMRLFRNAVAYFA